MIPGGGKKHQGLGLLGKGEFHGIIWDDMGSCLGIPSRVVQVEVLPFLWWWWGGIETLAAEGIWELLNKVWMSTSLLPSEAPIWTAV
jgi:hypothetical protein